MLSVENQGSPREKCHEREAISCIWLFSREVLDVHHGACDSLHCGERVRAQHPPSFPQHPHNAGMDALRLSAKITEASQNGEARAPRERMWKSGE